MIMNNFDKETMLMLLAPLPKEAVKPHPTKRGMSAINPIYVSERLNKVFGIGGWSFSTENEELKPWVQKTKNGQRDMFKGIVKCQLSLSNGAMYQTTASSDNDDAGDALKGAATDGLTKLASWLGVGSHVWKNQSYEQALEAWRKEWNKLKDNKTEEK